MNAQERQYLLDEFAASRTRLISLTDGLTTDQWKFRPAEERWSIGDCIEHVAMVEARVLRAIGKQLERPPDAQKKSLAEGKDALVKQSLPDRKARVEAP
jgi:uncharacterized damage-inducible protein DinB